MTGWQGRAGKDVFCALAGRVIAANVSRETQLALACCLLLFACISGTTVAVDLRLAKMLPVCAWCASLFHVKHAVAGWDLQPPPRWTHTYIKQGLCCKNGGALPLDCHA